MKSTKTRGNKMKFTKKAFRAALKANDQTKVWHLTAVKFGRTPSKKEVYDRIKEISCTIRENRKAYSMAYESQRKQRLEAAELMAWYNRGAYGQYGDSQYRTVAREMLRELHDENHGNYTNRSRNLFHGNLIGYKHLYALNGHINLLFNLVKTIGKS